jgi:hypothetical protein
LSPTPYGLLSRMDSYDGDGCLECSLAEPDGSSEGVSFSDGDLECSLAEADEAELCALDSSDSGGGDAVLVESDSGSAESAASVLSDADLYDDQTLDERTSVATRPPPLPRFGRCSPGDAAVACFDPGLEHVGSLQLMLRQITEPTRPRSHGRCRSPLPPHAVPCQHIYGTIRRFSATHRVGYALTRRNYYDLPNQLFFDPVWQAAHTGESSGLWFVNVSFAEWLMGVPEGWTSTEPLGRSAWSSHPVASWPHWARRHKTWSLFSGVGLLDFALHPWCQTIGYVENNPAAVEILRQRMGDGALDDAPIQADVRVAQPPAGVEVLVAGFPCQDTSGAGQKRGLDGNRTPLVAEVFRLCDVTGCKAVFLENVDGLRSRSAVWHAVLSELSTRGFFCRWVSLACSQVGAPQRRWRWFCLACRGDFELFADPLENVPELPESPLDFYGGRPAPDRWLTQAPYDSVGKRLCLLGNAVVPQQGAIAARLLARQQRDGSLRGLC